MSLGARLLRASAWCQAPGLALVSTRPRGAGGQPVKTVNDRRITSHDITFADDAALDLDDPVTRAYLTYVARMFTGVEDLEHLLDFLEGLQ